MNNKQQKQLTDATAMISQIKEWNPAATVLELLAGFLRCERQHVKAILLASYAVIEGFEDRAYNARDSILRTDGLLFVFIDRAAVGERKAIKCVRDLIKLRNKIVLVDRRDIATNVPDFSDN